jgi:hypothetical protein
MTVKILYCLYDLLEDTGGMKPVHAHMQNNLHMTRAMQFQSSNLLDVSLMNKTKHLQAISLYL